MTDAERLKLLDSMKRDVWSAMKQFESFMHRTPGARSDDITLNNLYALQQLYRTLNDE